MRWFRVSAFLGTIPRGRALRAQVALNWDRTVSHVSGSRGGLSGPPPRGLAHGHRAPRALVRFQRTRPTARQQGVQRPPADGGIHRPPRRRRLFAQVHHHGRSCKNTPTLTPTPKTNDSSPSLSCRNHRRDRPLRQVGGGVGAGQHPDFSGLCLPVDGGGEGPLAPRRLSPTWMRYFSM